VSDAAGLGDEICASRHLTGSRADCLRALILLWNDHITEAHGIVQALEGEDAAFIHGIIHRREPDFANARYWFQRACPHPILEPLAEAVAPTLAEHPALPYRLIRDGFWDPFAYMDAVSVASRQPGTPEAELLRELQRSETTVLARHLAGS
jgi:hypothetical protein